MNDSLIQKIHDHPARMVLAITGGGSTAATMMLSVPGASRSLIEANVPYDPAALADYIGGVPDQACSARTARAMAMAAWQRARRLGTSDTAEALLGLGCTAALTTDRERRGTDRCFVAIQTIQETREYTLAISRQHRDRGQQEALCAELVLFAIATTLGLQPREPDLLEDETLSWRQQHPAPEWLSLFGSGPAYTNHQLDAPWLIFPGSFNPLHDGHRKMVEVSERLTGRRALLEISAFNVDKPPLDFIDLKTRSDAVHGEFPLTFTNCPTFAAKAELFPEAVFVVGSDTITRIGEPRYYNDSIQQRDAALRSFESAGIRFLVFGRQQGERFMTLEKLALPPALARLCDGVDEADFRLDIASSDLRTDDATG